MKLKLNHTASGADALLVKGTLPVSEGFDFTNQEVVVSVGGAGGKVVLDKKGRFKGAAMKFKIKARKVKKTVQAGPAKFLFKMIRANLGDDLADEGLTNKTTEGSGENKIIQIEVLFNNRHFLLERTVRYRSKLDKKGLAR